jgi:hypothetical protein
MKLIDKLKERSKPPSPDPRESWVQLGRLLTNDQYKKGLKILEVYREADARATMIDLGSKKAYDEFMKDEQINEAAAIMEGDIKNGQM